MKKIAVLILVISSLMSTSDLFAWGQTGHRVVAEIAQNHLSRKAKKKLAEIMGHESLVKASTWMDNIKSDDKYDHTHAWHYVTIPENESYATAEKSEKGDAYEAIQRMIAVMKNEVSSLEDKKEAVRMLTHLIGDVHQPLHVGNGKDRGGNDVKIKWFYSKSNLHRIWDSEIIESKEYSYTEIAKLIDHPLNETELSYKSTDLDVWVAEAMALRPQVYAIGEGENLSYEYMYKNWETVQNQLLKGGLRLAAVLNEVLEN